MGRKKSKKMLLLNTMSSVVSFLIPIVQHINSALSADNTLTTLLTRRAHSPIGLWVMSAADDSTVTDATRELIGAGGPGDRVDVTLAPEGGHSGTLWKEQIPAFLAW